MSKAERKRARKDPQEPVEPARVTKLADRGLEQVQGGSENGYVTWGDIAGQSQQDQRREFIEVNPR